MQVSRRFVTLLLLLSATAVWAKPDFTLKDMEGVTHSLSDYRGQWVVVNYWATWCPPCREEMPELGFFHEAHEDAVVLGVNMENISVSKLEDFVNEHFVEYPILQGEPGSDSPLGPIPGLPTTYIVSPEGEVVARQVGPVTRSALDRFLKEQKAQRQQAAAASK